MNPLLDGGRFPSGWVCERAAEDALVFGRSDGRFEVSAMRTDSPLPFDLPCGWELTGREYLGESVRESSIGVVTTRAAAADALQSCMERVSEALRGADSANDLSLDTLLEDVSLRGEIPSRTTREPAPGRHSRVRLSH